MTTMRSAVATAFIMAILCAPSECPAQTATPAAATFEVASVKANTRVDGPRGILVDPGRFTATGVLLADLIRYAYAFNSLASQSQVIGGPPWIATARFDIVATSKGQPTLTMLKALLQDRFKVVAHVEKRDTSIYALLLERQDGRLGSAIHLSTSTCEGAGVPLPATSLSMANRCGIRGQPGAYTGEGTSMAQLARTLGNFPAVGRVVLDRTGMTGVFDWTLQWTPAFNAGISRDAPVVANPNADAGVSLFTALREQLGLRLEPQRDAVDMLVVERAELPTPD
jgi:uncharacterized protein (TIGR03435 family)